MVIEQIYALPVFTMKTSFEIAALSKRLIDQGFPGFMIG